MVRDPMKTMRLMAVRQHGLINRRQLLAAGFSEKAILWKLQTGILERIFPGVYLIAGTPLTDNGRLMSVYLWAGEGAALSHTSAAWLWGMHGFSPTPIHLSLARKSTAPREDICLHHVESIRSMDICWVDGIAVTSPARTLMDLAAIGHRQTERALDKCLRDGLTSLDQMWLAIDRSEAVGRRGVRLLRNLLEQRTPDLAASDSDMEDLFLRIVRWGRLPQPYLQFPIELPSLLIHADFAYPGIKLAIECDSYAWHMDREAFERDRVRDAELQSLGWKILRFTWAQLRYNPDYVLRQLRPHFGIHTINRSVSLS
jgi:very-short-patch-repair endonuclease